ncbi:T9SS type A sorting domain-containing protein [Aquimarina sp. 2201CG1-2-11]|uniref:T9SS type A sorting domain-containing protein n=1 Tax=Aquimarina discodermiae TaxID=3231043 RepID=UPI0034631290
MHKKSPLIAFAFFCMIAASNAQFNPNAPWLNQFKNKSNSEGDITFEKIQNAFNEYWKNKDPNKKGSGYKPFKRWEYIWEDVANDKGYLPTTKDQWDAWQNKQKLQNKSNTTDQSNWFAMGPQSHTNTGSWSSGQARVNAIIVDPNNSEVWYIGTPAGGLWKSTNAGNTWIPITDNLPQIGVSAIAIDYSNSDTIYIATGDDDASDTLSAGVYISTDGGTTWNPTGLHPGNTPSIISEIYIHPSDSNILWIASNRGVYKSTNAGTSWTRTMHGNVLDLKLKPGNPNIIYAVTSNSFFRSINSGNSFTQVSQGLPQNSSRMVIDVTPANTAYVYLLSVKNDQTFNGLYRSIDSGASFSSRNTSTDVIESEQAYYDLALGASTTNAEEIFVGCLNVWKSTTGGSTFTKVNEWNEPNSNAYTHADIHTIRAFDNRIFVCSDGGIYSTTDSGINFTDYTAGIQASQFYKIAISKNDANKMVGGLQDNGGHAYNENGNWLNFYGADGMDTAIDNTDDNKYYGFVQNGRLLCISNNSGNNLTNFVEQPSGSSGKWVTPLEVNSVGKVFAAYNKLYRLNDDESDWTELANLSGSASAMKIAPSNDQIIYIAVNAILKRSNNGGTSVSNVHNFGKRIKGIAIHHADPDKIWVTTSSSVHYSENGGRTFNNITKNLPVTDKYVFIMDIVHQPNHEQDPIYVGTSIGVYRSTKDNTWEIFSKNLPTTIVNDLEINTTDNSITVATYGRGIWRSKLPLCASITAEQKAYINNSSLENSSYIRSCEGQNIQLEAVVTIGNDPTFEWNGPNNFSSTASTITLNDITTNQNGQYTLTITSSDTCGTTALTYTLDIEENAIQPTINTDYATCINETITLTANGSTGYKWYNAVNSEKEIAIGKTFTSPILTENKTYYVAGTSLPTIPESLSTADIHTATPYNNEEGLLFDTMDDILLESFTVSAVTSGERTIEIVDATGTIITSKTLMIPAGESRLFVNFEIPKGKNHIIKLGQGLIQMKRTPPGNEVNYPYSSPNKTVSIIGNTANDPDSYFFFYDWNIKSKGGICESARTAVNITVDEILHPQDIITYSIDNGTAIDLKNGDEITLIEGSDLSLNPTTTFNKNKLTWISPSGTKHVSNTLTLTNVRNHSSEEGEWSVSAPLDLENCKNKTQEVVFSVNISSQYEDLTIFPNPVKSILTIGNVNSLQDATLYVYDTNGRIIVDSYILNENATNEILVNLQQLEVGTYFIHIESNDSKRVEMIVKH